MKIQRKKDTGAEVYTDSLNDIMFFLLLFFLIISTMVTPMALKVTLPTSSTSEQVTPKKSIHLTITRDMQCFIDDQPVDFTAIESTLTQMVNGFSEEERPNVMFEGDLTLPLQTFVKIADIGNRLGVKVVLFTDKEP